MKRRSNQTSVGIFKTPITDRLHKRLIKPTNTENNTAKHTQVPDCGAISNINANIPEHCNEGENGFAKPNCSIPWCYEFAHYKVY